MRRNPAPVVDLTCLDLSEWTPVAQRGDRLWHTIDGSPITVRDARSLYDAGVVLMAQRRRGELTELVVKARRTR